MHNLLLMSVRLRITRFRNRPLRQRLWCKQLCKNDPKISLYFGILPGSGGLCLFAGRTRFQALVEQQDLPGIESFAAAAAADAALSAPITIVYSTRAPRQIRRKPIWRIF